MEERAGAACFRVRVRPRASADAVGGAYDGALLIKTTAAPVDGAANARVIALLAKALGVPKRAVRIVAGAASRDKRVEVDGAEVARVRGLAATGR
ncbi:MAG: DUF167 domain-containing protein [Sandaracinaceae bacterium]|nr:DUF167 domain-containing protein [Sandaracinaceae bacterium]